MVRIITALQDFTSAWEGNNILSREELSALRAGDHCIARINASGMTEESIFLDVEGPEGNHLTKVAGANSAEREKNLLEFVGKIDPNAVVFLV